MSTFTAQELEEFQQVLKGIKNGYLKQLLVQEYEKVRTEFVDQLLFLGKTKPKETIIEEEVDQEIDVEIDLDEEETKNIKGYRAKIKSLQEMFPDGKTEVFRYALIKNKGNEEKAMEMLLTDFPTKVPKNIKKEKRIVKKKIKKVIKEEVKEEKIKDREDIEYMIERIKNVRELTEKKKKEVQLRQVSVKIHSKNSNGFHSQDEEKLYVPGEYDALENNENRIFTFKPERCVSNEVAFVHFRVAEAQFYRLLGTKNCLRVNEVKYICTPSLYKAFEMKRAEFAHKLGKKFTDIKPYLTFTKVKTDDDFKSIIENGIKLKDDIYFSDSPDYAQDFINNNKKILLFLVLTGKTYKSTCVPNEKKKEGYDSIIDNDSSQIKVFSKDQVLPYYIVSYESPTYNQHNKLLDEQWKVMEKDAIDDKFMEDTKKFYQQSLSKKQKERSLGDIDPTKDLFFQQIYKKRYEKEAIINGIEDLLTPGTDENDPFDQTPTSDQTPTFEE